MLDNPDPFTSRLVDYLAVFEVGAGDSSRLMHWYPVEDVLGAPLPVTELARHLSAGDCPTATPFALPDSSGVLFFGARVSVNNLSIVALSRVPRLALLRDALNLLGRAVACGTSDVEGLVKNLILDIAHPATDRATLVRWEGLGELAVGQAAAKSLPHVDDQGFDVLFERLSVEQLCLVFEAVLAEENVLLLSELRAPDLALAAEAVRSLAYPLVWQGAYLPLLPAALLPRALQCPAPFLFGARGSLLDVARRLGGAPRRVLVVDLDARKAEWLGSPRDSGAAKPALSVPGDLLRKLAERLRGLDPRAEGWQDHLRLSFVQVLLAVLFGYQSYVTSWSSSGVRREAGFDCENFLAQSCAEHFSFCKTLIGTRAFGDLVARTVSHGGIQPFEKLCKAWPSAALPPAARELLTRRYGYTERGARAVWARVRHLNTDDYANLFSSNKFRDFVAELGLSKDGGEEDGGGDAGGEARELAERAARLCALVLRDPAAPPATWLAAPRLHPRATGFPRFSPETIGLPPWMPARDHSVHWTRHSARLTFVVLSQRLSQDDAQTWRAATLGSGRPRLLLAFTGGSSDIRATLAHMAESSSQSSGSTESAGQVSGLKPVAGLACSMKFAQLQARRAAVDVSDVLFFLMEEERASREADMRRLRERLAHAPPVAAVDQHDAVLAYERRAAELEQQLRYKEIECENLARQLREKTDLSGASVRRTAPLFSPSGPDRPSSPTPSLSSLTSHSSFTLVPPSPNSLALRRKSSLGFDTKDVQVLGWGTPSRQTTPTLLSPQNWSASPVASTGALPAAPPSHPGSSPRQGLALQRSKSGVFSSPETPELHRAQSELGLSSFAITAGGSGGAGGGMERPLFDTRALGSKAGEGEDGLVEF